MSDLQDRKLRAYLKSAESWSHDREVANARSRRIAWIIASVAVVVALCEALALAALAPLKTVQPYTLLVDRQTGYVEALKPLDPKLISGDAALTQSFLVQYVIAREGFDIDTLQADYRKVALWSAGRARTVYVAQMQGANPESPLVRYPRSARVEVEVKSVTPMDRDSAMVRFNTVYADASGRAQAPQAWVTIIRYSYSSEPLSASDRFLNPLGFKVLSYRRSPEILTPSAGIAPPSDPLANQTGQP